MRNWGIITPCLLAFSPPPHLRCIIVINLSPGLGRRHKLVYGLWGEDEHRTYSRPLLTLTRGGRAHCQKHVSAKLFYIQRGITNEGTWVFGDTFFFLDGTSFKNTKGIYTFNSSSTNKQLPARGTVNHNTACICTHSRYKANYDYSGSFMHGRHTHNFFQDHVSLDLWSLCACAYNYTLSCGGVSQFSTWSIYNTLLQSCSDLLW